MAADIRRIARELLDKGYTEEEIRQALIEDGYQASIVDSVLDNLSSQPSLRPTGPKSGGSSRDTSDSRLWRMQQYSWLMLFVLVLGLYGVLALSPTIFTGVIAGLGGALIGIVAGVILLFHLVVGLYQWFGRDQGWEGKVSTGAVVLLLVSLGAGTILGLQDMASLTGGATFGMGGTQALGQALGTTLFFVNLAVLLVAIFTTGFFWPWIGGYAAVFPFLFLVVAGGIFGVQYMEVTGVAQQFESPSFETSVVEDQTQSSAYLFREAARTLPPFTRMMVVMAAVSQASGDYALWRGMKQEAIEIGALETVLTGPRSVCGGTQENINDRVQNQWLKQLKALIIGNYKYGIVSGMEDHRKAGISALEVRCTRKDNCEVDQEALAADYDRLVAYQKQKLQALQQLLGVQDRELEGVYVDRSCESLPEDYYRVELQNISCGDQFTATLANTGTRRLSGIVDVYAYSAENRLMSTVTTDPLQDWDGGERMIAVDMDKAFARGEPYRIELRMLEAGIDIEAYCVGGGGFCESCHKEARQGDFGDIVHVLVR